MHVGTVVEVWRYPVKSMGGERLTGPVAVTSRGIEGDRVGAVVDDATGKVLSAKTVAPLLMGSAAWDGTGVRVCGDGLQRGDDLSSWLGRSVHLAAPVPGERAIFDGWGAGSGRHDMDLDPGDTSEIVELQTPPGSFFDSRSTLHLLTTASLGAGDVRRYRPNFLVAAEGEFPEDGWIGRRVRIGDEIEATVRKATSRCVLTTRAQPGLPEDRDLYRHLVRTRAGNLGVYLDPQTEGTVREGDAVEVVE